MPGPGAVGAVLCGGASRRMGVDKATLPIDGVPMALRVVRALRAAGVEEVVAVGGGPEVAAVLAGPVAGQRVYHVPDDRPGAGPLAAIATALAHAGGRPALVVACDLVAPSPDAMARCLAALAGSDADVAVPVIGDRAQWVHGAWTPAARPVLEAALAGGERAIHQAVAAAGPALVVEPVTGLDPSALADADTPADLPVAVRPASGQRPAGSLKGMQVPEIDVTELAARRAEGAPLIDVREDDEYAEAHAPGAHHIALGQVPDRVDEVPRDGTVYVICRSGGRSAKAAQHYRSLGIDAVNVAGGTLAWIDAGQPVATGPEPG